jgi:hypothetical protein
VQEAGELAAPIGLDDHALDRLGGKAVARAAFQAEHVAREVEGVDLATAVAQELAGPHGARDDLVEEIGGITLGEQLLTLGEVAAGAGSGRACWRRHA